MTIAKDAKLRRNMRNQARRNGDPMGLLNNNQGGTVDNLLATYKRARDRNSLLQALSKIRNTDPQAQRLYKALQNHWYNRTEHVQEFMVDGKPVTRGKEKQTRKSSPLIRSFY
ncbi:hypothetical protein FDJ28_gp65 [Pseudomonas phage Bjorn]|uniref:Uncharacterized protein n=1 Tax=Pseudomonas phage Bjorn TaxID=2079288 RepID=A0A2K9VHI1_9CAUD|nr:hypothetical protein FDJ28_gp65 [Pseudomonas phage Bjorn]AUV61811.1 hypothetical protein PsPhBjorn_gp05 [Pseudomonas phage Bjorn]